MWTSCCEAQRPLLVSESVFVFHGAVICDHKLVLNDEPCISVLSDCAVCGSGLSVWSVP